MKADESTEEFKLQAKIPTWLHRQLKANASLRGMPLQDYVAEKLELIARSEKKAPKL